MNPIRVVFSRPCLAESFVTPLDRRGQQSGDRAVGERDIKLQDLQVVGFPLNRRRLDGDVHAVARYCKPRSDTLCRFPVELAPPLSRCSSSCMFM